MKRFSFLFVSLLVSIAVTAAEKFPKKVEKVRSSVLSILTYSNGVFKESGTAVFAGGNGDILASYSLMLGADSAVVIDNKGVVRPVIGIVGLDNIYDCVKLRVATDKKISYLPVSETEVHAGDELYMLSYGKKNNGTITKVKVSAVDSLYSHAYYTLDINMQERYESLPVVNAEGGLVALVQPSSMGDSCSYAIAATIYGKLATTSVTYGKGYYDGMCMHTLLPSDREAALSCMYMQAVLGDSLSYRSVIDKFIESYPSGYEGYLCSAEHHAVYCRDMDAADLEWKRAISFAMNPAEVHFNKAKVINSLLMSGDSIPHGMLSFKEALNELDKAIELDNQPLYVNYKADMLFSHGNYAAAAECYRSLASTVLRSAEVFAKASQCYGSLKDYDASIEMLDSAVAFHAASPRLSAPYMLTRAIVKMTAKKYREAVIDFNRYEEAAGGNISNANFFYMRGQAELGGKMYQQALNDFETSIYLDPENPVYYIEKGVLCYRVKLADEGIRALNKAKELAPEVADVYYLLGCLYIGKNETELARENLEKAHSLGHPDALVKLNVLK